MESGSETSLVVNALDIWITLMCASDRAYNLCETIAFWRYFVGLLGVTIISVPSFTNCLDIIDLADHEHLSSYRLAASSVSV